VERWAYHPISKLEPRLIGSSFDDLYGRRCGRVTISVPIGDVAANEERPEGERIVWSRGRVNGGPSFLPAALIDEVFSEVHRSQGW